MLKTIFAASGALPFLLLLGIVDQRVRRCWSSRFATNRAGDQARAARAARRRAGARGAAADAEGPCVLAVSRRLRHAVLVGVLLGGAASGASRSSRSCRSCRTSRADSTLFADPPDDDAVHHAEHEWNTVVQVVLFLFGLVNAGVHAARLRHRHVGRAGRRTGRPAARYSRWRSALALAAGLHLPRRVGWRELVVVALATSSGFTFALFFATGLLPTGPVLTQIKIGALATVAGALLAFGAARLLRVGRFASASVA